MKKKLLLSKNKNKFTEKKINLLKKTNKTLIIPAGCMLYVGIDLATEKDSYLLQIEDHQDIMCAIAAS